MVLYIFLESSPARFANSLKSAKLDKEVLQSILFKASKVAKPCPGDVKAS